MGRAPIRSWIWIVSIVGLFVVVILAWIFWPLRHLPAPSYPPANSSVYVFTEVDPSSPGTQRILAEARRELLGPDPGRMEQLGWSMAKALAMPRRVSAWVVPGSSPTELDYVAVIDFGRGGRLIRAFGAGMIRRRLLNESSAGKVEGVRVHVDWRKSGRLDPGAFAFTRDSLLVASSLDVLRSAVGDADPSALGAGFRDAIGAVSGSEGLHVIADNRSGALSTLIAAAEEEVAFSLMPSADSLQGMSMTARLDDAAAVGSAVFLYDDPGQVNVGYSDIRYTYGIIRRLLRPRGLDMDADISSADLSIQFDFTIEDFLSILQPTQEDT